MLTKRLTERKHHGVRPPGLHQRFALFALGPRRPRRGLRAFDRRSRASARSVSRSASLHSPGTRDGAQVRDLVSRTSERKARAKIRDPGAQIMTRTKKVGCEAKPPPSGPTINRSVASRARARPGSSG